MYTRWTVTAAPWCALTRPQRSPRTSTTCKKCAIWIMLCKALFQYILARLSKYFRCLRFSSPRAGKTPPGAQKAVPNLILGSPRTLGEIWQEIVIASRIPPRPYSTEACHSGAAGVCEQVMRFMTAVTKIASHQQDGSDAFLGFVMHTRLLSGA